MVQEEKRPSPKRPEYDRKEVQQYMRKQQLEKQKKVRVCVTSPSVDVT